MGKKTHKLTTGKEYDFKLIGISSHENDYRVCWIINQHFEMQLNKTENLEVYLADRDLKQEFSLYYYYDEDVLLEFHLISNRCDNGFLIEELRNIDYFLKVTGECDDPYLEGLVKKIKGIGDITTAFAITIQDLKSKNRLLF